MPLPAPLVSGRSRSLFPGILLAVAFLSCSGGGDGGAGPESEPTVVQMVSGNDQAAAPGTSLGSPFVVELLDAKGRAVGGRTVTWAVAQGGGTVSPASSVTNAAGEARTFLKVGGAPGAQRVRAAHGELQAVTFSAMATGGVAGQPALAVLAGDGQTGVVATTLAAPIKVRLVDGGGAPLAGAAVQFAASGNGTVTPASATTDANGEAGGSWRLGTVAGAQTVGASTAGAPSLTFTAAAVAAAASQLTIVSGNNQVGAEGRALTLPLVVRVADAFGNPVAGTTVSFSATSGGGSVAPGSAPSDAAGRASTTWTLGTAAGAQGAVATVAGIGNAVFAATATPPITALAHRVVDAEYDPTNNRIVTVSANPSRLHIVDPETGAAQTIDLAQVPNAVAVRADGQYAAVGHNAWISYVNLATRQVERVYPVTTDVVDIVLASNGWVHAFPRTDQWETIRSIELATGAETRTGTIRAGTLVKLHPSGRYIYGANNGLSPSDIEKYDIRSGAAAVMYDSPYHGDYAFNGDLWISEDGLRVFAKSGNVFRSSEVRAEDLLYGGHLQGMSVVQWAAQSTAAGRIFALPGSSWDAQAAPELRVYESGFLAYRGAVALPRFVVPTVGSFAAEGRYVFPTADGQRLYVLVKADNASGIAQDWGIVTYDLADLP